MDKLEERWAESTEQILTPLEISQALLMALSTKMFRYYENRIPQDVSMLIVSNHRSFMDAPILIAQISDYCHEEIKYLLREGV